MCKLLLIQPTSNSETTWGNLWQRVQLHISASLRWDLNDQMWRLDLLSPFWRLYVNECSGAWITFNGQRIELLPGRLYLIPAWVRFQTGVERPVRQNFIHFYLTGLPPTLLHQLFDRPYQLPQMQSLDFLADQWKGALQEQRPPGLADFCWSYALTHASVAQCAMGVLEEKSLQADYWLRESSLVWPAVEHIEAHLSHPVTNSELAALCNMSPAHFIRQFHSSVGVTPVQYGLERRIASGAYQLINTNQSIEQIADATGFSDRFHFSKAFKNRMQVSPAAYRNMHRGRS